MRITEAERKNIELMNINDIPDKITKEIVIMLIHRMFQGNREFGDWMSDKPRDPRKMMDELQEELCDSLCYIEMGKRGLDGV